ncbi:MAG: hypothetical protein QM811_16345 [Pirellulales bacterium]
MSFYSALNYVRPGRPPKLTGADVARFIERVRDSGLVVDDGLRYLNVKFGKSIDRDARGTSRDIVLYPNLVIMGQIDWDLDLGHDPSLTDMITALRSEQHRVYRLNASLGAAVDGILRPLTRAGSPENEIDFLPYELTLQIGPIESFELSWDEAKHVGWIAVGVSGPGYLFPWTFEDVEQRLRSSPEIERLAELCRTTWPVEETASASWTDRLLDRLPFLRQASVGEPVEWKWYPFETG